ELLLSAPQSEVNEIRELFGALYLPECAGNSTDYEAVLQFMKRRFASLILLEASKLSQVIEAASTAAATFKPEPDTEDYRAGYERVRVMLAPLLAVLPREGECLARLASFRPEAIAAFAIVDRQMRDYPTTPN